MRSGWRGEKRQSGQAIVLIALLLVAMIGFLGLVIDGGRLYVDRRQQQLGADSAALAAADQFLSSLNMPAALAAGAKEYAANADIPGAPSASPAWCATPPSPAIAVYSCSTTVTWGGTTTPSPSASPITAVSSRELGSTHRAGTHCSWGSCRCWGRGR